MEHVFISFRKDENRRADSQDLQSRTVGIDFNVGRLFFCDAPLPEAIYEPHITTAHLFSGFPAIRSIKLILEDWIEHDTKAHITKHFRSDAAFKKWRASVGFSDYEILWQVYIRDDDRSLDVLLSFGPCLPQALRDVFTLAQSVQYS